MFGGTNYVLLSQRATHGVNRIMFTVACLLLLFSTMVRVACLSPWDAIDFFWYVAPRD